MVNFKIRKSDDLNEKKEEFIQLYNDTKISCADIPVILGITPSNYATLRKQCLKEGLITYRHKWAKNKKNKRVPSFIHYNTSRGTFSIVKNRVYYCSVRDYGVAVKIVDLLKKKDWDKSKMDEIKAEVGV